MSIDLGVHLFHGGEVRQIPLVELHDERDLLEADPHLAQVVLEVLVALGVRLEHLPLGVGDEDDAVRTLEHQLAGRVVGDLAGDGVELQPGLHAADLAELDRQEIEEEGPVGLGGERQHLSFLDAVGQGVVDVLEVGGLAAEAGAVVDDLRRQLAGRVIEEDHPISQGDGNITSAPGRVNARPAGGGS